MIVSTRGRYALRVMIDIAEHPNETYIPLKSIAARQGISEKYLESILKILVQEHLLEGIRGKGGGYRLTMSPSEYTIGRILRLTETSLEEAEEIVRKLQNEAVHFSIKRKNVSISYGVSCLENSSTSFIECLDTADKRMYENKAKYKQGNIR